MLHLTDMLPDLQKGTALDVGTRFGEFAFTLKEAMPEGSRILGLDCVPETVAQAREKQAGKGLEFVLGDAAHLDFPDHSMELVAISNTLHHIEHYDAVLDEMLRVLRPGGYFLVNEMFSDHQNDAQQTHHAQHSLEAKLDVLAGGFQRPTWKKDEIIAILRRLPLTDVQVQERLEEPEMDRKLGEKTVKLADAVEKKAAGKPEHDGLLAEAQQIQARYARTGIQRCTQLVYVGRKPQ
ncbi:MAG: methyltransferase domain-containing protein [Pseudoflavonifractor sp.]